MGLLTEVNGRMQSMEKRLDKLESLDQRVEKMEGDLKRDMDKLWCRIGDTTQKLGDRIQKLEDSVDASSMATGQVTDRVQQLEDECRKTRGQLLYLQSQSMRSNLLFSGIPEEDKETNEVTERILRSFMVDKLGMLQSLVDEIRLDRVHRTGHGGRSGRRNIVAKFA